MASVDMRKRLNTQPPEKQHYILATLADHLASAAEHDELYRLVSDNKQWMELKFERFGSDAPYATDLALAIGAFAESTAPNRMATLATLYTARQVVNARVGGYTDPALRVLVWLEREEAAMAHARLRAGARHRFDGLMAIYHALEEREVPDTELLEEALETIPMIGHAPSHSGALVSMAEALGRAGDARARTVLQEALVAADNIENYWGRVKALLSASQATARGGNYERARAMIQAIGSLMDKSRPQGLMYASEGLNIQHFDFDLHQNQALMVEALISVAEAMERANDGRASVVLEEALKAARVIDNQYDYRAPAVVTVSKADPTQEEILKAARQYDYDYRAQALVSVSKALTQAGLLEKALETALTIDRDPQRVEALIRMADVLLQTGDRKAAALCEEALPPFFAIVRDGYQTGTLASLTPDEILTVVELPLTMWQAGDERAEELFEQAQQASAALAAYWHENGMSYHVWSALAKSAKALAQMGQYDDALQHARLIEEPEKRTKALLDVSEAMARAGDERAAAVFEEAQEPGRAGEARGYSEREALLHVSRAMAQAGLFDEALQTARVLDMERPEYRVEALVSVSEAMSRAGDERAGAPLEEAQQLAPTISDSVSFEGMTEERSRRESLVSVSRALARAGRYEEARNQADAIEELEYRVKALLWLCEILAEAGRYEEALEEVGAIEHDGAIGPVLSSATVDKTLRSSTDMGIALRHGMTLVSVARAMAETGHHEEARKQARAIKDPLLRARALCSVAEALAQAGYIEGALQTARAIDGDCLVEALVSVSEAMMRAGNEQARELLEEARIEARAIDEPGHRAEGLTLVSEAMGQAGDVRAQDALEEAREAARHIESKQYQARAFCKARQFNDALSMLSLLAEEDLESPVDKYVSLVADWASLLEHLAPRLSITVLRDITGVAEWSSPRWREIHNLLSVDVMGE